jgi:hypothetical protein
MISRKLIRFAELGAFFIFVLENRVGVLIFGSNWKWGVF